MKVPLSKPDITEREIAYVTRVLRTGELSLGPVLREFERKFADYVGTRYAVATSSGTAALHLCVKALGVGAGDEMITTAFSFVASANCLLYEQALPIFVDIDPQTLNLDPHEIRDFLRERCRRDSGGRLVDELTGRVVKGILPVHVFGLPCDMDAMMDLAGEYNLMVLEDACEALGAEYRGRRVGTFGKAAVFAFYPNKQMTTAEGGMIVTNDETVARLCRSLRNQGRDEGSTWLQHDRLGYNYRLSDVHCALGLAQLERIEDLLRAREAVAAEYHRALAGYPMVTLPGTAVESKRSWFVYVVQLNGASPRGLRDGVLDSLRSQGIGCQAYFPALHRQRHIWELGPETRRSLQVAELSADRCLALPFSSKTTREEVEHVSEVLRQAIDAAATASVGSPSRQQ
ncbi:MAG TPA: DegT/DnrJ/EryC1/StrS family aminotransferase [Terriglobia bacterium]|jgi:perosamine synthetase|nr:DegT/DnrJ/EryC1/StrS family aminotransferase [Terriglobia bacterium]